MIVFAVVLRPEARPGGGRSAAGIERIRIAYTPDSDDAFIFYAWEQGHVGIDGVRAEFHRAPIDRLNEAARQRRFDVVAVSSAFYPQVAGDYAVLTVGNSIGRRCGPRLVSGRYRSVEELDGRTVGVGGHPTTGSCLALMFAPGIRLVVHPFDEIIERVSMGELDAGVMIHEEIVAYERAGLHLVRDLGAAWGDATGLPLPVGLNVARRSLGPDMLREVATACERSLLWGLDSPDEAYAFASGFGRGLARQHLGMFRTGDTLRMPEEARRAVREMGERIAALGLGPRLGAPDFVEGEVDAAELARHVS